MYTGFVIVSSLTVACVLTKEYMTCGCLEGCTVRARCCHYRGRIGTDGTRSS